MKKRERREENTLACSKVNKKGTRNKTKSKNPRENDFGRMLLIMNRCK
jgi:hypothetical protein